jgi:creatinine amidohydrolase
MKEVRWEKMFPDEIEKSFDECPVIYFTYGLCEPHGPQNVLGLDELKAHGIACETAKKYGGIVAPPDFWHVHDVAGCALWGKDAIGEVKHKWLTAVPPSHHFKSVCYHIRTADVLGAHTAIFLTGHYGPNWQDLKMLIELIQPYVGTRLYGLPDFEANIPGFDNDGRSGGDHAGRVETSLMMALDPSCSDMTRLPAKDEPGCHWAMGRNAYESNRKVGERMVMDEVEYLGKKVNELLSEYNQIKPEHKFRTYDDVDKFWNNVIIPKIKDFACLQLDFSGQGRTIPEDSVWYENWKCVDKP